MARPPDTDDHDPTVVHDQRSTLELPGVELSVVQGPNQGEQVTAHRGVVRVGTAEDNDLVLADKAVSRRHLEIRLRADQVRVVDLASTNGTTVDGVRVIEAVLSAASLIGLGDSTIRVSPVHEPVVVPLSLHDHFGGLLGHSVGMRQAFSLLERVAPTTATVLIEGESGTGKELAAEGIHAHSDRSEGPFVAIDCGAIAANLIESELFGHLRGAFTGASDNRLGAFEQADGGTLFFDEIGELPIELQPKLLRALEKRQVRPLGGTETRSVDVRVLAATNRDLAAEVNRGAFREDLYFRLAVVRVTLPPLRARPEDIAVLIRHFVDRFAPQQPTLAEPLITSLGHRPFPGNVRELRNQVQRALALGGPAAPASPSAAPASATLAFGDLLQLPYKEGLERLQESYERSYLERVLRLSGGSVSAAARLAGLSRRYVQTLMIRHGLRK